MTVSYIQNDRAFCGWREQFSPSGKGWCLMTARRHSLTVEPQQGFYFQAHQALEQEQTNYIKMRVQQKLKD